MCLDAKRHATENLRKKMKKNGGKIVVYKTVLRSGNQHGSRLKTPYRGKEISPGWLVSDRIPDKISFRCNDENRSKKMYDYDDKTNPNRDYYYDNQNVVGVDHGIHVFVTLDDAKCECLDGEKVVSCIAYLKDFVAAGDFFSSKSAVFNKVFVPEKEYNRVLKE